MMGRILAMPLMVILLGIAALAMFVPAIYAAVVQEHHVMRSFFYWGLLLLIATGFLGLAMQGHRVGSQARSHLLSLLGALVILPLALAAPFREAVRDTTFLNAYFEMVSAITTTGATLYEDPGRLAAPVHLWRALVGWMGGFFVWVIAVAVMAPLNLGGFEVLSTTHGAGADGAAPTPITRVADTSERLTRYAGRLFPVYGGLSALLWMLLIMLGEAPFVALCHAMSTLATSGISPVGGTQNGAAGYGGELLIFLFLIFALSRRTFAPDAPGEALARLRLDPELRMAGALIVGLPVLLVARHWVGAYEVSEESNFAAALAALWGGMFMVMSFLSTAGFESAAWEGARAWSGLQTPGMLLLGLAMIGGGVATTAGGVKLLRVYALYKHGVREMEKLVHPNSIGGAGVIARRMRRQGAYVAWLFFMLFAMSVALVMLALSATGQGFETATILTVASLSTTGPVVGLAGDGAASFVGLPGAAKLICAGAMVLGRLETLAFIALLNPAFWRS